MAQLTRAVALLAGSLVTACTTPAATVPPGTQQPRATPGWTASPAASPGATRTAIAGTATPGRSPLGTPAATARPTPGEGEFVNPVLDADFPDPHVIEAEGTYYAYATQGGGRHIQLSTSSDMVTWTEPREALPELPDWTVGNTWAPEVARTAAGFVMYYTLGAKELRRPGGQAAQCISYALADDPAGPFDDSNEEPFVCQADMGGSIDAHHFVDADGTGYLVWKNDGNCCSMPTRMWIQQLSEDGTRLVGKPTDMGVLNDQVWEFNVIEAPSLLLHDGTYLLFYSANRYDSSRYAVGYATADRLRGPYVDAAENPILASDETAAGPGHQALIRDANDEHWVYYHAWDHEAVGPPNGRRAMWLDELVFERGRPLIDGPDIGPQPAPEPAGAAGLP